VDCGIDHGRPDLLLEEDTPDATEQDQIEWICKIRVKLVLVLDPDSSDTSGCAEVSPAPGRPSGTRLIIHRVGVFVLRSPKCCGRIWPRS
jgi:hypothetical protein